MAAFEELPEGCIAAILSRTTPLDAGRLSLVSKNFRSASEFDEVWDSFLRSASELIDSIISNSPSLANIPTKKALFLALCDHPVIIDNGRKSFQLHKKSGKKCYMLAARSLAIFRRGSDIYFNWIAMPESRFPEVIEILNVSWLVIRGKINTLALSPNTQYETYLVFNMINGFGFEEENYPVELSVDVDGGSCSTKIIILVDPDVKCTRFKRKLDNREDNKVFIVQRPSVRSDGWLEIKIGEFINSGQDDGEVQMSFTGIKPGDQWKRGFFVEGIEIRPKEHN